MEPVAAVGARVRALRKRRGLTQEALAGRIGRSVETLSALERGKQAPSFDLLQRLSAALEVSLRDFFASESGAADPPQVAALLTELTDAARTLPFGDLDMAVRIVDLVAARHGRPEAQRLGAFVSPFGPAPDGLDPLRGPEAVRDTLSFLTRLYRDDPEAMIAALKRRRRFFEDRSDPDAAAFIDAVLKAAEEKKE